MAGALILFSFQLHAMEVVDQELREMESIDEIPDYCTNLVEQLSKQPTKIQKTGDWFPSLGNPYRVQKLHRVKKLPLKNKSDWQIFDYLNKDNRDAPSVLKNSETGRARERRIQFRWFGMFPKIKVKSLRKFYRHRIRSLQFGWRQEEVLNINLRDLYGDISPQDCLLFSKKQSFEQEGQLIDSLASKFNISSVTKSTINLGNVERTYLAIEKDSLEQVKSILNFTTNEECAERLANDLKLLLPHSQNNLPYLPPEDIQKIANKCWDCDED